MMGILHNFLTIYNYIFLGEAAVAFLISIYCSGILSASEVKSETLPRVQF